MKRSGQRLIVKVGGYVVELPSDFGMEGIVELTSGHVVAGDYLVVRIDDGNLEVDGDELLGERSFYGEVSPGGIESALKAARSFS